MTWQVTVLLPGGGAFKVDTPAITLMVAHRQIDSQSVESGGILIGRLITGTRDAVVDSVSLPQPGDRRSRFRIDRIDPEHQRLVEVAYAESGGTYLGEWHTHPEPHPSPSSIDLQDWRRKAKEDTFFGDGLVFMILGTQSMGFWYIPHASRVVTPVGSVPYEVIHAVE